MMIPPAINLGIDLRVLAEAPDSSAQMAHTQVGDYRDVESVVAFARDLDVVTFDHEHVPQHVLDAVVALGVPVRPGPHALVAAQDKTVMRAKLSVLSMPMPEWAVVSDAVEVGAFMARVGTPTVIAKTPTGGYDGKGVRVIAGAEDISHWLERGPVLLEEKVDFVAEVAQLVARRPSGDSRGWPLVETRQKNGVCAEVIAPAGGDPQLAEQALDIASRVAKELDVTGVLAVEMFVRASGELVINELAMRPHNSGHIFTELSHTSQFEQHLRAVLDLPLGSTALRAPHGVMVNIFGGVNASELAGVLGLAPHLKVHDYGKSHRPGRKAGHVSVVGDTVESLLAVAQGAVAQVAIDGLA